MGLYYFDLDIEQSIQALTEALHRLAAAIEGPIAEEPTEPVYGPPSFAEWFSERSDVRINSLTSKPRKPTQCSICGMTGVNAATHPQHGGV